MPQKQDELERPARQPSRIASAIAVLRGEALVPVQIRAEWAEYQLVFSDLLNRMSAMLARQAKYEKKRAQRLAETAELSGHDQPPAPPRPASIRERKAELRRRAFGHAQGSQLSAPVPPAQPAFQLNGSDDE